MARHCALVFLVTLLSSAGSTAAPLCDQQRGDDQKKPQASRPDDPPRWKWWQHPESRKDLRLTDQQAKQIDQIFESTMPKQRERWHELEKLEDALARTIKENIADVVTVTQQVEKVERLRAEHNSIRTVMIYRMHLVLNPEQRAKVEAMRARREEERKRELGKGDRR